MKNTNDTTVISLEKFESKDFSGCLPSLLDAGDKKVSINLVIPSTHEFMNREPEVVQSELSLLFFGSEMALLDMKIMLYPHDYGDNLNAYMVTATVNRYFIEEVKQEMKNFH